MEQRSPFEKTSDTSMLRGIEWPAGWSRAGFFQKGCDILTHKNSADIN